jgi:hypothetical protein
LRHLRAIQGPYVADSYVQAKIDQPSTRPRRGKLQIGAMVIGEGFSRTRSLSSIIHVIEMRLT